MDDGKYWEGLASVLDSDQRIDFIPHSLGQWPLKEKPETLRGLQAFSHNYLNYRVEEGELIVSDLRLGMANNLAFEFIFAQKSTTGEWQLLDSTQRYPSQRSLDQLGQLWQRLKGDQSIDANLEKIARNTHS